MKKAIATAVAISLLSAVGVLAAEQDQTHQTMHQMKHGGPKLDERIALKLPAPMKVMQLREMRQHLDTIAKIVAALAASDLSRAAQVANEELGWNKKTQQECKTGANVTGEADLRGQSQKREGQGHVEGENYARYGIRVQPSLVGDGADEECCG